MRGIKIMLYGELKWTVHPLDFRIAQVILVWHAA